MMAETYILLPEHFTWLETIIWHGFGGNILVSFGFGVAVLIWLLYSMIDAYLFAFHRKSGNRLMYDGEPEEWRWSWK